MEAVKMGKAIVQSVRFGASGKALYDLYMDAKKHAAVTGGKVKISAKPGSGFSAFDGMLSGTMLYTVPGEMVVQRWRGTHWTKKDLDSILVLKFLDETRGGRIELTHVNVPDHDHAGVSKGWPQYYWGPMKKYLKGKSVNKVG
jgi:activator of HSP90 ATPase